jgi:hypothetical protein
MVQQEQSYSASMTQKQNPDDGHKKYRAVLINQKYTTSIFLPSNVYSVAISHYHAHSDTGLLPPVISCSSAVIHCQFRLF